MARCVDNPSKSDLSRRTGVGSQAQMLHIRRRCHLFVGSTGNAVDVDAVRSMHAVEPRGIRDSRLCVERDAQAQKSDHANQQARRLICESRTGASTIQFVPATRSRVEEAGMAVGGDTVSSPVSKIPQLSCCYHVHSGSPESQQTFSLLPHQARFCRIYINSPTNILLLP